MRWPWVSGLRLELAEEKNKRLEREFAETVGQLRADSDFDMASMRIREEEISAKLTASEAERKLLLDRIVQMSGQPALYEKAAAPVAEPAQDSPPVSTILTFDKVHQEARTALRDGTFKIPKGRSY